MKTNDYTIIVDRVEKTLEDEQGIYSKSFLDLIKDQGFTTEGSIYVGLAMECAGEPCGKDFALVARREAPLTVQATNEHEASQPAFMEYMAFSGGKQGSTGWGAHFLNCIIAKNSGGLPADILEAAGEEVRD